MYFREFSTKLLNLIIILILCLKNQNIKPETIIYYMKIRGVFNIEQGDPSHQKSESNFSFYPFGFKQNRHILDEQDSTNLHEKITNYGLVFNYRYTNKNNWWIDAITGLETEKSCYCGSSNFINKRIGFDDILLTGGYIFYPSNKTQFVLYGSAGLPTRYKVSALEVQNNPVGSRFFNLGAGAEISYNLFTDKKRSIFAILQSRFIHFFDRRWFPILPYDAKIQPGNTTDILCTLLYMQDQNILEIGYDATFSTNEATIFPFCKIKTPPSTLHNYYLNYSRICANIFDSEKSFSYGGGVWLTYSKQFNTKSLTWWLEFILIY